MRTDLLNIYIVCGDELVDNFIVNIFKKIVSTRARWSSGQYAQRAIEVTKHRL
jgi:hypothetical protein